MVPVKWQMQVSYVGAETWKVHLYKKKELIEKGVDEKEAVDKLIELIKMHDDWQN